MPNELFNWEHESQEERRLREQKELEALMEQARIAKAKRAAQGVVGSGGREFVQGDIIGQAVIGTAKIGSY